MANHKSAAKRARQTVKKTEQNLRAKSTIRTFEKKLRKAIEENKGADAQSLLLSFTSKIDKAAQKGIIHAKQAARKVSRLSRQVSSISK